MREIIDCHSHIGADWLWGHCDMNKYLELAEKLSITESMLMIAPDLMIIYNKHRLMYQPKDTDTVLSILSDNVDHNKIMFDVDFSWNVNNGQEKIMDYNQVDRVNNIFNEKDRGKVLSKNARRFFKL